MRPELVIFDMDGLLLDTERLSFEIWKALLPGRDEETLFRDYVGVVGRNDEATVDYVRQLYPQLDIDTFLADFEQKRRERFDAGSIPVKEGAAELLDALDELGIPKCLATSNNKANALVLMEMVGFSQRFDGMVFGDMVQNGKPDPEIFLKAAALLNTPPENCLVLEDSVHGVQAALAANMPVIMVPDLIQPDAELQQKLAAKLDSLLAVIPLLD